MTTIRSVKFLGFSDRNQAHLFYDMPDPWEVGETRTLEYSVAKQLKAEYPDAFDLAKATDDKPDVTPVTVPTDTTPAAPAKTGA